MSNLFKINKNIDIKSKKLVINSAQTLAVKGGAIIVSLLTLPAYLKYFDNEMILGIWFTAISILTWILTFDLGIGNGLRNHLVKLIIINDTRKIKQYISSAYIMITCIVIIFSVSGYLAFALINWNLLFNVSEDIISSTTLLQVVRTIYIGIMIQFVLKLISSILLAMQKAAAPSFIQLSSSLLLLGFLLTVDSGNVKNNLILLSFIYVFTVNIPFVIVTLVVFNKSLKKSKPNLKFFKKAYALDVIKLGGIFFWLQLMTMIVFATNEFLISFFVGPEKVVDFQVYNRIFALISTMFLIALTPVWSAVTEASTKKDYIWISKLYRKLNIAGIIAILSEIIIVISLPKIVDIWLGEGVIVINTSYSIAFAVLGAFYILLSINSSIVSGLGILKIQLVFLTIGAVMNIPLAWIFTSMTQSWIGIIIANIISILPYCIIQPFVINKFLRNKRDLQLESMR